MEDMPADEHHGAADPTQAFEDLRAEVSVLRRAVEALPAAWEENQSPDYSPDLGRMTKGLAIVAGQLDALDKHPALRMTPEQHRQAIAQAGNGLMREAAQKLDQATRETERERQQLAGLIGTARRQDEQRNWLAYVGLAAFVVGLLASPFLAGVLPFGGDAAVASMIMKADRWDAGWALLRSASPVSEQALVNDSDLVRVNQDVLTACNEVAAKMRKDQRCTIIIHPPVVPLP